MKGIVIAGAKSGSGKTTVTLGLLSALVKTGRKVAAFKVGPDFIDPGHHTRITGRASRNLDGWMLSRDYNQACFSGHARGADVAVVEGVMGLFDGYDGRSEAGSTAQMAKWLGLPVLLVVDARSMARSAAALVQGFERFDPDLAFAGVLFNNVGSPRHLRYLEEALAGHVHMPCLGGIGRNEDLAIPERHLGLVTAADHRLSAGAVDALADLVLAHVDLEGLLDRLPDAATPASPPTVRDAALDRSPRIGVARDNAFCFYYPDNLDLLERSGATVVPFSPMADARLPADLDGLYLGGGYPELYAEQLALNRSLRDAVQRACTGGMPIYGECGGFMYLGRSISDTSGRPHPMCGCFPFDFRMLPKLRSLGYREVSLTADTPLGGPGQTLRGHEFHYSEISDRGPDVPSVYRVATRTGQENSVQGHLTGRCLGSYVHLHFGSNPRAARSFVTACHAYHKERTATDETR